MQKEKEFTVTALKVAAGISLLLLLIRVLALDLGATIDACKSAFGY